jgi:hypothetical protein
VEDDLDPPVAASLPADGRDVDPVAAREGALDPGIG